MTNVLTETDFNYYRSRMSAELELASSTDNARAIRAHRDLAVRYGRLIAAVAANDADPDDLVLHVGSTPQPATYHFAASKIPHADPRRMAVNVAVNVAGLD